MKTNIKSNILHKYYLYPQNYIYKIIIIKWLDQKEFKKKMLLKDKWKEKNT